MQKHSNLLAQPWICMIATEAKEPKQTLLEGQWPLIIQVLMPSSLAGKLSQTLQSSCQAYSNEAITVEQTRCLIASSSWTNRPHGQSKIEAEM